MKEKIVVVTDSTANLTPELLGAYKVPVIPLSILWGEDVYKDGVTLSAAEFYEIQPTRKQFPTTSQPSVGEFMEFFRDVAEQYQADTILGIFISSELSGTLASAIQARAELPELRIELVDSRSVSMGLGFQSLVAARAAQEDIGLAGVLERVYTVRDRMRIIFAVDTLEYLHRGGRIGGAAHLLGTTLNLKPLLAVENGRIESLQKVRSRRKSLSRLMKIVEKEFGDSQIGEMGVLHAGCPEDAEMLFSWAEEHIKPRHLYTAMLTPVIGAHGGPGTVGLGFYTED